MDIAISTCFDYSIPITNMIPLLVQHGFRTISIGMHRDHCPIFEANGMASFQSLLDQQDVRVHSIHIPSMPGLGLASSRFEERMESLEIVKKGISDARELQAHYIILHATTVDYKITEFEQRYPIMKDNMAKLLDFAGNQGVKIALENLYMPGRNRIVTQLLNDFPTGNLGLCFDTSHANLTSDPLKLLRHFGDRLFTTHISDNNGEYDDHLLPFEGKINWQTFIRQLKSANRVEPLLFEPEITYSAFKDPPVFLDELRRRAEKLLNLL